MRRYTRNVLTWVKLMSPVLIAIPFFFGLALLAFLGITQQKNIVAEIFLQRSTGYENSSKIMGDITGVHRSILTALRKDAGARPGQEGSGRVAAIIDFIQGILSGTALHDNERRGYMVLLEEIKEYKKLAEAAEETARSEAVAAGLNERYLSVLTRLRALQSTEYMLTRESYELSMTSFAAARWTLVLLVLVSVIFSLWFTRLMMNRRIIGPIRLIEQAARKVTEGDLSFDVGAGGTDDIKEMGALLNEAFATLEGVLQRIKELSDRILLVVEQVEAESAKVLSGAEAEAEATSSISSSVNELNATAAEIADSTEGLTASAGEASASIEQMVSSIKSINESLQDLNGHVESTSASIEQLSQSIQEVASHSENLAGTSVETLNTISEIATTIRDVEVKARDSARLSAEVTNDASTLGMVSIHKTIEGIRNIASSVRETSECIRILGNRSKEIEGILNVIESVNDETNLLSLNAAILAAEAGEHGKGFAVVAEEIKNLSDRTETSTKEIEALIKAVQQEIENAEEKMHKGINSVADGLRLAREGENALKKILSSSQKASEMTLSIKRTTEAQALSARFVEQATQSIRTMIESIAKETAEQSKGVVLITDAADMMKKLTQQVSKATGEQARSSGLIAQITEFVSEKSKQISKSLLEHKKGSQNILSSVEAVKDIPEENKKLAFRISKTLWNLQKDAELLKAEMERFKFSAKKGQSLRLGVVPLKEPSVMFRKFMPFAVYLTERLGRKVDLKVAIDMESAVKDIGQDETQICAMGPANYIEANMKYGVTVIAKALRKGRPFHHAAVVVREKSDMLALRDLKGKRLALGSSGSSTGHIMPLATLKDAGISVRDLQYFDFLGHHEKIARAVLEGDFDAGVLIDEVAESYIPKGLRVLALSIDIPEFNICCNPSVDRQTRKTILEALTALNISSPAEAEILKSLGKDCTGFVPAYDEEYAVFKEKTLAIEAEISTAQSRSPQKRS
ncbi:MAG: HAMP domain-containing protein [Nitrospirae bacterium]|nr:MAG: HAMP domain-containing protein [Nitrospirota bacterium]